jgi:capsular polysaccharide biosynthesis protein
MKNNPQRIFGFVMIGIGLMFGAVGIYGLTRPDEFRAWAKIAVAAPDCGCIEPNDGANQAHWDHRHQYYSTLIKTIPPEAVLSNVVAQLKLTSKWGKQQHEATRRLRRQLDTRFVPNTTLIEIGATSETPAEAALIANTVVANYKQWRTKEYLEALRARVVQLKRRLEEQDRKIALKQESLLKLQSDLNIPSSEIISASLATNFPAFNQAQQDFKEMNDVRDLWAKKIQAAEKEELKASPALVEFLDQADPPKSPFRRKKTLSVILIVAALSCCGWGLKLAWDSKLTASSI